MSFGIGCSDILAGIKIAVKLYDYGFAEENRADVRYRNFRNELLNFRILLQRLDEALQSAQNRWEKRGPTLGQRRPYEPLSEDFEAERVTIVGNFVSTLQECEALLEHNRHLRERSSNVLENLYFNLSQQEVRVEHLRHRLNFHSQKIRLVIDRLSINLLTDIDAKVDDILAISEQNLQISNEIKLELRKFRTSWLGYISGNGVPSESSSEGQHAVSASIAQRFLDNVRENAPTDLTGGIPLQEGFDALLLHFEQSCESGSDQTPERYLLFLKSRWLLDYLKQGTDYKHARPGFYYRRAINQVEQAISERLTQPGELIAYDENTLMSQPDACFHTWSPDTLGPVVEYSQPHPLMVRGDEVQVAHIELAPSSTTEGDSVTVFKSSDEHFRVVHENSPASTQGKVVITPHKVHISEDNLIPRYAFPTLASPCHEIAIFSRSEEELFNFSSIGDLHRFQSALMGYDVSHDQGDVPVRCQLKLKNTNTLFDCRGRIQLWQEPIGSTPQVESSESSRSPSLQAPASTHRPHSRHDSLASSLPPPSTITTNADGWEADSIKLPSIAIFTQVTVKERTRFAAISIPLRAGMKVDPRECSCHRQGYETCASLVITKKNKQMFPIHMIQSETDSQGRPNPNTFDIFPLRLPRHPDFSKVTSTYQAEYILLNFKSLSEKQRFHKELDLRFEVRDKQIENQRNFEKWILSAQDKPQGRQRNLSASPTQLSSSFERPAGSFLAQSQSRNGSNSGRSSTVPVSPRQSAIEDLILPVAPPRLNSQAVSRQQTINTTHRFTRDSRTNSSATTMTRRDTSTSEASHSAVHSEIMAPSTGQNTNKKQPWWKKL
ncbi:hypothetical protein M409DRAFT_28661 [Zasmidium cellare ATCC 36951]|uniref:Uncharacterized protein n=1 Tax=Zasmidium cellare ATCC 36951 TaxID=1080233 RepID=A0A6A6C3B6_ZASCE|nr:uncharacterized protein M409DRAFT_28661 [Zasmidium cellare ATCC 36951]KAF2160778.1 hypothetical protein M409DRAFT_28661 [Zasmidium cellare ATCC 36951]